MCGASGQYGLVIDAGSSGTRLRIYCWQPVGWGTLPKISDVLERESDDLDVTADDFLVLQNAGPRSPSGMPEAGYLPIPGKLARAGVKDMVRISDARMSGTAFGTIVLHVTPEASAGGPLGLVQNGDRIRLSVSEQRIDLLVDEETLRARAAAAAPVIPARGYNRLYAEQVLQADGGCDFDMLRAEPAVGPGERENLL